MRLAQKTAAITVGALGCLFIWIATPYNNFLLNNNFISDDYLPEAAIIFFLLLVLILNPLLHKLGPDWSLTRRQFALIFAMLLMASIIPGQGVLRQLPWSLAGSTQQINASAPLSEAIADADINQRMFPENISYDRSTPISDQFLDELHLDNHIPWSAWLRLAPVWLFFLLSCWLLMIGTGLVLFPQWRDTERLAFPLLQIYRSLFPDDKRGHLMPAILRNKPFWAGAGLVLFLYALIGLNHHTQDSVPGFPLGWQLRPYFAESPWLYMPWHILNVEKIYFVLVGMAFFMPNRVGFSIWFTVLGYGVYTMLQRAYFPPYYGGQITDHRNGAMIAVSVIVLYLSRKHWLHVAKVLFRRVATDQDRLLQVAGWMLLSGAIGMHVWLRWVGVPHLWSAFFVLIGFMVSLLIARIVAETGLPFVRVFGLLPAYILPLFPAGWISGAAIYIAGFINMFFQIGSRISASVIVSHAVSMDEQNTPRNQIRLGYLMIAVLVIGFLIGGAVHIHMGYTQGTTIGDSMAPVNEWGATRMENAQQQLVRWHRGSWHRPEQRLRHINVGIIMATGLYLACMMMPKWPLHPIGLLMVGHYYGNLAWASIFLGWSVKVLLIRYGGAAVFRRAQPFFLGLILGEIFSAVIWTAVPVLLILFGADPSTVDGIYILPT